MVRIRGSWWVEADGGVDANLTEGEAIVADAACEMRSDLASWVNRARGTDEEIAKAVLEIRALDRWYGTGKGIPHRGIDKVGTRKFPVNR